MYVCNCNGIRTRQVDEAISAGACRPSAVHAHHGCKPKCARCLPEIAQRMRELKSARASVEQLGTAV
jgi:bacterioferritin-associated ferredoxin